MSAFPAGFSSLNHRDFRVFWSGQLVSLVGTWMQRVGQAWLVLELTNSPFKLGLISALQFTPVLLFAMLAGAVADRMAKRRLLVLTQTVLMLQAGVLTALVWTSSVRYWHVAVLATVYGLANAFDMPTRQAFIADMVGRRDIMNAIALNSAMFNAARLVGPAVAGLLIAQYGLGQAFLLNALSFLAVIAALFALRTDGHPHPSEGTTIGEKILGGLQYAITTPLIGFVLVYGLSNSIVVALIWPALLPIIVNFFAGRRFTREEALFERQLADALGVATRSLRAGHPLMAAFQVIVDELDPPVSTVFAEIIQQQQLGKSLEESIRATAAKSTSEDMKLFAASTIIQLRSGGNLADMMDRLVAVIRDRIRLQRRVRVLTAQTQFSKRVLICMPFILIALLLVLKSDYLTPLAETHTGRILIGIAAVFLIFGSWVMNKIAVLKY